MSIQIYLDPNYPSGEPVKTPMVERVRDLADYLAGLLGPDTVRRADPNQPPYPKDGEDGLHYQLDQGNDWFLNAELEPGGTVVVSVTHRYYSAEKLEALRGMLRAFTRYRLASS